MRVWQPAILIAGLQTGAGGIRGYWRNDSK